MQNIGARAGHEVVQLYMTPDPFIPRGQNSATENTEATEIQETRLDSL